MANGKDKFNYQLAMTVENLFSAGNNDPNFDEIADALYPGISHPGEQLDGIRKRLPAVRKLLEEKFGRPAYLVSDQYYARFKREIPMPFAAEKSNGKVVQRKKTEEEWDKELRACLPIGSGVRAAGIRLNEKPDSNAPDDALYLMFLTVCLHRGSGMLGAGYGRALSAYDKGRIQKDSAVAALSDTAKTIGAAAKRRGAERAMLRARSLSAKAQGRIRTAPQTLLFHTPEPEKKEGDA